MDAVAGGNIGTALSELALREPQPAWAVVECSSFQLAGIRRFTPRIGVLTNLAPDHLDWYDGRGGLLRRQGAPLHQRVGRKPVGAERGGRARAGR